MANQQISNPPTAAYYLTLIGGILGILYGAVLTMVLLFTIILWPLGVWVIIANALMISYARKLMTQPNEHGKYGVYILVLSIFGGLNVICLIGGILALAHQPTTQPYSVQQPYQNYQPYTQQPTTQAQASQYASAKYCPQCGNAVGAEAAYCPKCGTKLPT
jgi:hypothetical protein